MQTPTCFRAERCFHRCGSAVLLLTLVACADDNPVAPGSSPVPSSPTTPSPSPAPPDAPGSVRLTLSRVDVVFNAMAGGALRDSAEVAVTAQSGATVIGLRATVDNGRGMPADWLAIELDQATLPARLSLRANSPSLAPGEYTATVKLAAPGAMPESLSVVARVTTGPGIGLNATRICFTKTFSGPLARPDDVRITSLDGSAIDGLSATVTYDPGTSFDWLRPRLTATSAPARLWLESFPGLMLPGTYHATVQVSSTTPGVAPVSISVTLEIRPNESSTLSVSLATVGLGGAGNGRLTATGIDCVLTNGVQGGDCEESYAPGTVVHVTALPAAGQVFYARCPLLATCTPAGFDLSMHAQEVRFEGGFGAPPSTINVIPRWAGPEYGASTFIEGSHGLRCVNGEESCSAVVDGGIGDVSVTAFAEYGGRFLRWEGACTGDIGSCTVHFDTPGTTKEVIAVFRSAPSSVVLSLQGDGASGSVTVSPALTGEGGNPFACELVEGVAQPGCQGIFEPGGGTVTLTASPAPGSRFAGWDIWLNDDYGPQLRCADPLSATCVLTFAHGNGRIDGYVNFAPQ